jgi:hypothetical protein
VKALGRHAAPSVPRSGEALAARTFPARGASTSKADVARMPGLRSRPPRRRPSRPRTSPETLRDVTQIPEAQAAEIHRITDRFSGRDLAPPVNAALPSIQCRAVDMSDAAAIKCARQPSRACAKHPRGRGVAACHRTKSVAVANSPAHALGSRPDAVAPHRRRRCARVAGPVQSAGPRGRIAEVRTVQISDE